MCSQESKSEFYELSDPAGFIGSFKRDKAYELIREKVNQQMALHPQGLLLSEQAKLFKYWVGAELDALDAALRKDIDGELFAQHKGAQGEVYLVMKGSQLPQSAPNWKCEVYALSPRHQLICTLSTGAYSRQQLAEAHRTYFGVALDCSSFHTQQQLERLIDHGLLARDGRFAMSGAARDKERAWIAWWQENGPGAGSGSGAAPAADAQAVHYVDPNAHTHSGARDLDDQKGPAPAAYQKQSAQTQYVEWGLG